MKIKGRAFLLLSQKGELARDIDTDQIYHNRYLHVTDPEEMKKYALLNLEGYEDFPQRVREGDILVAGHNFGAGSSRQHAVTCFIALKVGAILASSFAAIYKRNAINSALPILECPHLEELQREGRLKEGHILEIDFEEGRIRFPDGSVLNCKKPNRIQLELLEAGGLLEYGKRQLH